MMRNTTSAMFNSDMKASHLTTTTEPAPLSAVENLNNSNRQYPPDILQEKEALARICRVFSTRISGE
ncbi:hypothetical protein V5O48_011252 [Marasmius crinis-equi]|uniref:Uncharacterized protein n=1 Tax=Marasmius crinis-equi TaxID=585013 RepID=A0ABR3F645_9AGAR